MKRILLAILFAAAGIGIAASVVTPPPAPAPTQAAVGWHGDRYYDGHRYWERKEWEEHQREHGGYGDDHCPPGLEKQGRC